MIWIECMGPSGVGKSYYYQRLITQFPELNPDAILYNRIKESKYYKAFPIHVRLGSLFVKWNIKPIFFRNIVIQHTLKNIDKFDGFAFDEADKKFIASYFKGTDYLFEDAVLKLKKIEYFSKSLLLYKAHEYFLKENDIYIAEDGIMHQCNEFLYADVKYPKAVFYFKLDHKKLLQNRFNRIKTGNPTYIEATSTPEALEAYVTNYNRVYKAKIEKLRAFGTIDIFEVESRTENCLPALIEKVKSIQQSLIRKPK